MQSSFLFKLKSSLLFLGKTFGIIVAIFITCSLTQVLVYKWINPPFSNLMLLRKFEAYQKGNKSFKINYKWVPYNKISKNLKKTVLIGEDPQFFDHYGFIPYNVKCAFNEYMRRDKNNTFLHGYSTITQQTAKNVFLYPSKTPFRKALEIYYALLMELIWGKVRILEIYLNIIECGDGIFGAEAASTKFFKKPAIFISKQQASIFAATLINPRRFHIEAPTRFVLLRAAHIYRDCFDLNKFCRF